MTAEIEPPIQADHENASARPLKPVKPIKRNDTREALIRWGTELCTERGFQVTGIEEVLKRAGVPKGSFYYFFGSKHKFGEAVIENYTAYFQKKLDRLLGDRSVAPLARLAAFIDDAQGGMAKFNFQRGCLVGNLGQELGGLNDSFRQQLEAAMIGWQQCTADCLRDAIAAGEVSKTADADQLAAVFWIGWEGAILRAKLTQSVEPIKTFAAFFFKSITLPGAARYLAR